MQERVSQIPIPGLLALTKDVFERELFPKLSAEGFGDLRPGHGCVFGTITFEGARLTDLAERARLTKQAVGEVVSELEKRGYVERVPDPDDRRAKIIMLTERGREAWTLGQSLIAGIRTDWEERYGEERVATMIDVLAEIVAGEAAATPSAAAA
jgi:DNA-binding MarR family transcriptional regulator